MIAHLLIIYLAGALLTAATMTLAAALIEGPTRPDMIDFVGFILWPMLIAMLIGSAASGLIKGYHNGPR